MTQVPPVETPTRRRVNSHNHEFLPVKMNSAASFNLFSTMMNIRQIQHRVDNLVCRLIDQPTSHLNPSTAPRLFSSHTTPRIASAAGTDTVSWSPSSALACQFRRIIPRTGLEISLYVIFRRDMKLWNTLSGRPGIS